MKKKVVIIGANDFQNPLILKAKELGYETHVFAWKDGSIGEKTADFFYPISIVEKDEILEKCREIKPDAILTIASDLATITVNYVASKLGLTCNSLECTDISTNKFKMRQAFKKANIPVPKFEIVDENTNLDILNGMEYPLIVKPTDRSGSRAINKILKKEELSDAIKLAVQNSFEKKAIIEEYIDGDEFSAESISFHGKHNFLTVTRKQTTGYPHFIETGHIEPAGLSEQMIEKIKSAILPALDSLKIENGASHAEFKITPNGDIRIIEIGARMGGDCIGSDLVKISTGYDYVKMVIDVALGQEPILEKVSVPKIAVIKFIFNKEDLDSLEKIKKEKPEKIYFVSEIKDFGGHKIVDSSSRYGYYILALDSIDEI